MTAFADLSHHNAAVNVAEYARHHDRVMLKATEGISYIDPTFSSRWRQAGAAGLARGAYHFARARFNGADEFDHFLATVHGAGGLGPRDWLCLDAEDPDAPDRARANATEFTTRAVQRGHTYGWVYTGKWYANPNGITAAAVASGWRHLWLSDYTVGQADTSIEVPKGWAREQLVARQFTNGQTTPVNVAGIGPCDYNRVLNDWITTTEDDVSKEDVLDALDPYGFYAGHPDRGPASVRRWVDEATKDLTASVAGLRAQLATVASKVGASLDVDEQALAAALAPLLTGQITHLSADDLAAVARAVNDELARRQEA